MVPALPSFKLHKFVSQKLVERNLEYRTGVVYITNRRVWEHDDGFHEQLREMTAIATEESDRQVTLDWADVHLEIRIASLSEIGQKGEAIKHYQYKSRPKMRPIRTWSMSGPTGRFHS